MSSRSIDELIEVGAKDLAKKKVDQRTAEVKQELTTSKSGKHHGMLFGLAKLSFRVSKWSARHFAGHWAHATVARKLLYLVPLAIVGLIVVAASSVVGISAALMLGLGAAGIHLHLTTLIPAAGALYFAPNAGRKVLHAAQRAARAVAVKAQATVAAVRRTVDTTVSGIETAALTVGHAVATAAHTATAPLRSITGRVQARKVTAPEIPDLAPITEIRGTRASRSTSRTLAEKTAQRQTTQAEKGDSLGL